MNRNICRPIILFNNFVPPSDESQTWEYEVMGYYDGISIGDNIFCENFELKQMWTNLANYVKCLDGKYTVQIMYVFRNETDKSKISDESFWAERTERDLFPYLFVTMLRIKQSVENIDTIRQILEEKMQKSNVKVITYLSLDNNDLVVAIRSSKYCLGTEIINMFHQKMENSDGDNASPFYDSFSVGGINKKCLNSEQYKFADQNETIDKVCLRIIEREPGTVYHLKEKLQNCVNSANIVSFPVLGCEDEVFIIENILFGEFLKLYQDFKGILSNSNIDVYQKSVMGITSLVLQEQSNPVENIFVDVKNSKKIKIRGICKELRKKYIEFYENSTEDFVINEKIYYKAILQIINSLQKYENMEYIDYAYIALYEPIKMLTELLDIAKINGNERLFSGISVFFNAVNLLTQNSVRLERQFIQSVELNARIYEAPVQLSLFYKVYFELLRDILNECAEEDHKYEFMICPGMVDYLNVQKLLPYISNSKRLLLVEIPENQMYDMKNLLIIMVHEAAHFVGRDIRQRRKRYDYMLEAIVKSIGTFLVLDSEMHQYCSEEIIENFEYEYLESLKIAVKDYCEEIEALSDGQRAEEDRYHTEYMREDLLLCAQSVLIINEDLLELIGGKAYYELCKSEKRIKLEPKQKIDKYIEFSKEFENNKLYFVNKMVIPAETLSDEPCLNNVVDSNIHLFKESFADLMSVLLLELSLVEYLETIFFAARDQLIDKEDDKNKYSMVMWRIALVIKAMCKKNFESNFYWKEEELDILKNKNDSPKNKFIDGILEILGYMSGEKTIFDIYEENSKLRDYHRNLDRMYNYKIGKIFIKYLCDCRFKFQENIRNGAYNKENKLDDLREIFRKLYCVENVEEYIFFIREIIVKYKDQLLL